MIELVSFNLKVWFNQFKLYDNNEILINKIIKCFLYYFNYPVLNTQTQAFNLENSNIFDFGAYSIENNQMSPEQPIKTVILWWQISSITFLRNED